MGQPMRLTRNRRLPFPCGHKGLGETCNRCKDGKRLVSLLALAREDWLTKKGPSKYVKWDDQAISQHASHLLSVVKQEEVKV